MTVYAHIENNTITGVYDLFPDNWRNISNFSALATDSEFLHSLGWRTIIKHTPEYDIEYQRLGKPSYAINGDDVVETIEIIDLPRPVVAEPIALTEEQIIAQQVLQHEEALSILRTKRDLLLIETDFTQLQDVITINGIELTAQYVTYRQLLRDLPGIYVDDIAFVDESTVIYPQKPGVV